MKKEDLIFIHKLIKAIADSVIKVFIPLYILKVSNDINLSLIYLVAYSSFVLLTMGALKKIIQKYGVLCIMLHFIFIIASNAVLSFAPINVYTVIGVALLMSFSQTLYSVPLNLIFTFGDKKSNVAKFQIPSNIGKLLFTLGSGLFLSSEISNSFLILSIVSSVLYIGCVIPLLFTYKELTNEYTKYKEEPKENIKIDKLFILFHIMFGLFQPIMDNLVPLFLYVNNLSFKAVTIMIVLVELLKIFINLLSQFLVKKHQQITCVVIGFILALTSLLMMIFVKNATILYISSTVYSISFPLTFVPMLKMYCEYIRKSNNIFEGMTKRDFQIFYFRPVLYLFGFTSLGMIPIFILGLFIVPTMLYSEIKLIRKYRG